MIQVTLLLVYLLQGELKQEVKHFETMDACVAAAQARVKQLVQKYPDSLEGRYIDCVENLKTES